MCDIFPEVENCCNILDLRLGMLVIAILCVMTGVLVMSVTEQRTNANFKNLKNVSDIDDPRKAMSSLHKIIPSGMTAISVVYMFGGLILLFGNLSDNEGFVQVFVWMVFLAVMIGYLLVILISVECFTQTNCLLADMDWLSGAAFLVLIVAFLSVWIYFISVANSYVVNH